MRTRWVVCCLGLVTVALAVPLLPLPVLAEEEEIELDATYPRVESESPGAIFKFPVSLLYRGGEAREFHLRASGPPGWSTYVTSMDETIRVSVIKLEPNQFPPDQVKIIAAPPVSASTEIRDYTITLVAGSGNISGSIELTAAVRPAYSLELVPTPTLYHNVTSGEIDYASLTVSNTGSGDLTGVRFSVGEPEGWTIEFHPDRVDRLTPGASLEVELSISTTSEVSAGYHRMTLVAEADQTQQTTILSIRVAEPEGSWLWVGVGIAVGVAGAFALVFLRIGRGNRPLE
ncbi:MAG: hypothetical protein ISS55_06680 [Dehalococcoidales bacterium]|nr:hypothetical protein [Dehalococcoidales bacterium]